MIQEPQGSGLRLKIEFSQVSDPGRDPNKQVNEDSCGYAETRFGHLCVVCDGMGGHYGGKEASRTAITTIFEIFDQAQKTVPPSLVLKGAIEEAGRRVYRLGGSTENRTRPGSTVVALLLHDRGLDVAHVGDSRAYIIRSNQIYPLTRDHSMVQGMIDAGLLTEETAMGHPDSNKITRALGMRPEVEVEVRPEPMDLYPGDILLQASDGLTDLALGREILATTRQALAAGPVSHACSTLVQMANDRGGHDNITVQMVRVVDVGPKVTTTLPDAATAAAPLPSATLASAGVAQPAQAPYQQSAPQAPSPTLSQPLTPTPISETRPMVVGDVAHPQAPNTVWVPPAQNPAFAAPPPPPAYGPPATLNDSGPGSYPQQQPWTSSAYGGAPVPGGPQGPAVPAPSPSGPRFDAPAAPPSGQRLDAPMAYGGPIPQPPAAPYFGPMNGPPLSNPRPGSGGIVLVIVGVSVALAAVIIFVVWWVWLRGTP